MDAAQIAKVKEAIKTMGTNLEEMKKKHTDELELIKKGQHVPADLKEQIETLSTRVEEAEGLKEKIEAIETAAKRGDFGGNDDGEMKSECKEYGQLMSQYLRKGAGVGGISHEQSSRLGELHGKLSKAENENGQKFLAVQSNPDGGYWVSPDETGRITQRVYETSPMRQVASVQGISTDSLEGVWDGDEAGGQWVGETEQGDDEKTPQIGQWSIFVHELKTSPKATRKLLMDSAVNVEQFLGNKVGRRFARLENTAFVLGDGDGKPKGFLTYPAASTIEAFERGKIGQKETAAVGVIAFDDLYDLQGSLKDEYEVNSNWAMNRRTRTNVRKLKDDEGRYLWEMSQQVGEPSLLLGRPVVSMEDMPNVAADALAVAIADFTEAYQIVDREGISVLVDPFTAEPFTKFITRKRVGGDVVQFDAIKLLKIKAA
jgi:HK97 family phage major capsid protein